MSTDKEIKELGALEREVGEECKKIIKEKRYPIYRFKFDFNFLFPTIITAIVKTIILCLLIVIFLLSIHQFSFEQSLSNIYLLGVLFVGVLIFDVSSLFEEMEEKTCRPVFEEAIRRVVERSHASEEAKKQLIEDAQVPPAQIGFFSRVHVPWRRRPFNLPHLFD